MKALFYSLIILVLTSCSVFNATGQNPYQYTSVSEQVIIEDQYFDEPITYINYTPTFSFTSYYSYYWWRPYRPYYFWNYNPYSWNNYGWNSWGWNSWNNYGWNNWYYNPYSYYPYYLNNWSYYNYLYHPFTYSPYYGFNNFGPSCHSPFYMQTTNNWKQSLKKPHTDLKQLSLNQKGYTSIKPQPVKSYSDNTPVRQSYDRPKQDLRVYNQNISVKPETRTYQRTETPTYRNNYNTPQRQTYQEPQRRYETPVRSSYDRTPKVTQPTRSYQSQPRMSNPSRSYNTQPRMSSPSRNYSSPSRQSMGLKKGTR